MFPMTKIMLASARWSSFLLHLLLTSLPFKFVRQGVIERRSVPRPQSEAEVFEQAL